MHASKAVRQDATLKEAPQLALHIARQPPVPKCVELSQEALGVLAEEAIEQRLSRVAAAVASDSSFAGGRGHTSVTPAQRAWLQAESPEGADWALAA
jgi:hypothetical protein